MLPRRKCGLAAPFLVLCSAFCLLPTNGEEQAKDDKAPTETLIKLTVDAAAAPTPALRYQLLPEFRELQPGNPVQAYLACFCEQNQFFFSKESADERSKWEELPLKDLPDNLANYGGLALRRFDEAARLDLPDWQVLLKLRRDGIMMIVPEVQQLRTLAWSMHPRLRGQIKAGKFAEAVESAKTLFALSRHLDEHPTLISGLVAAAVAGGMAPRMEEFVQQPGSPNLFWAYANLPRPLVSFRKAWQGERLMILSELEPYIQDKRPMTDAEIASTYAHVRQLIKAVNPGIKGNEVDPKAVVEQRTQNAVYMAAAHKRLVALGMKDADLAKMPAAQVAMLDSLRRLEAARDEGLKWFNLPYHQAEVGLARSDAEIRALAKAEKMPELEFALGMSFLSLRRLSEVRARLDMRFALLAHVEALRLYAAEHQGQWPPKLDDVKLPLPANPLTGGAFDYRAEGDVATLRVPLPKHLQDNANFNVRYEVRLRK